MSVDHYQRIAADYEALWAFTPSYAPTLSAEMARLLKLAPGLSFLDIGCGVGHYTWRLAATVPGPLKITGVDPSEAMITRFTAQGADCPGVDFRGVCDDATRFLAGTREGFDRVLVKECINHFDHRPTLFVQLRRVLSSCGLALIVTRPQRVEFPFFEAALEHFAAHQPSAALIAAEVEAAGLTATVSARAIPIRIARERLLDMIRRRFMSTFHAFDDAALAAGIAELREHFADTETLVFDDRLIFIVIRPRHSRSSGRDAYTRPGRSDPQPARLGLRRR
jgi:SAM-dependent methyltransferase